MAPPVLIACLLLGLYMLKCAGSEHAVEPAHQDTSAPQEADEVMPAAEPDAPVADDLTRIRGIGKSAAAQLQAAGFVTFHQIAALDEGQLIELLGSRWMKMETWPEQARLAAAGNWQALKALQNEL